MNSVAHHVGLDYHQNSIQVCIMNQQGHIRLNQRCQPDLASLLAVLGQAGPVRKIALEACEGAADLGEALAQAGPWSVELAHPLYVARIKGSPDKSDWTDAKLLADLSRVGYLPRVWLPPKRLRQWRQLMEHRHRLADDRRALKLRVGSVLRSERVKVPGSRWSRAWVQAVQAEPSLSDAAQWLIEQLLDELADVQRRLKQAEDRLRQLACGDAMLERLMTLEGVGEVTAWTLRAAIGRFDRFKNAKQLCRYCGLSPRNTASGERQTAGGLIDAANRRLRAILIQAAQRLIRTDDRWGALAARLMRQGKARNVAVAAVANRWMRTVHQRMLLAG